VIVPRCSAQTGSVNGKRSKSQTSCNLLSVSDFGQVSAANGARRDIALPCAKSERKSASQDDLSY
jgi:hypothetical protein